MKRERERKVRERERERERRLGEKMSQKELATMR